ncbi:hypothetical protein VP01_3061g1 [Puccinia sorghi]|uniref:Uncharacterized protein n=1 Tax=Puccinia sorghi TaxID=27349 RepID=A0A0L6UZS4_9BASI|nr:hypothetical protein VP01_3061g1 [Puccinia sorghi]
MWALSKPHELNGGEDTINKSSPPFNQRNHYKKTKPQPKSIIILSDWDKTAGNNKMGIVGIEDKNDVEITGFQECEIDEQNSSKEMVQFIQASLEGNISNEDEPPGSNCANKSKPFEALWPILNMVNFKQYPSAPSHKLLSGKSG